MALQSAHDGKDPGLDYEDNEHWPHCLDYLRKASFVISFFTKCQIIN